MAWWCGPGMADCRDCHVRSCGHCHPWSEAAKTLVAQGNQRGLGSEMRDNTSGAESTLATSPGTSTSTRPLRGSASRGA